ncbi:putative periplasmic protein kinase ArgK and related GTPases of G3E family [invertebrate metagenome]|uniref:Putative periplasmic protein kinase ArgK and related GTPases of G3E family n=1 Tax=invertebrate metagenome TaxID=1711999 RepID=A0A484H699_9ZZZZ
MDVLQQSANYAGRAHRRKLDVSEYVEGVRAGSCSILGRAITMVESRNAEHHRMAEEMMLRLLPHSGRAHRVGITGVPGVGKSTFIESLGTMLTGSGYKVAVLAVDPSSTRTGGSILGDKTRMEKLSVDTNAFIRPSPAAGTLGGVARKTRETMLLCEAAGYDVILVETVGVGQSETVVADMVDFFLVLMLPGAGDELQGIKKGVLEIADMIAINKADGENERRAQLAAREYSNAMRIMTPASLVWKPPVVVCAGLTGQGLRPLWEEVLAHRRVLSDNGEWLEKRQQQQIRWMWSMLDDKLMRMLHHHEQVKEMLPKIEQDIVHNRLSPSTAAERILGFFLAKKS